VIASYKAITNVASYDNIVSCNNITTGRNIFTSKDFPAVTVAPVNVDKELTLRLFVDRSSIEAFGEDGKFVMTNLVFPSRPYVKMCFEADKNGYAVKSLNVYKLQ
jgi:fructan beta-fructosidase